MTFPTWNPVGPPASPPPSGPWQPTPRAAHQPSPNGLGLAVFLLFWFSPLSLFVWLGGQLLILAQKRWHWHRFALAALAYITYVLLVLGPQAALRRHFYVHQHFWQYLALMLGFGPKGTKLSVWQVAHDLVVTQVWLAAPVGILAAALAVYFAEHAAGGAEWSPLVRRRRLVDQRAAERKTAKLLANPRDGKLDAPVLGIALDGDLPSWAQGRYVVPPPHLRGKAMAIVGAPGAGKTVTTLRLAYVAGRMGRKVCFADCKGTDPTLVPALINAYRLGNPTARIGRWPATPMDMWRGTPSQVQSRLLAVEVFTEPFYQRVASAGLRLALTAPGMPPVDGSDELLRRLDADELASLWEGHPLELKDVEVIGPHLPGARLRYADFFAALAGAFDRGAWSYEDVDLAVLTVPTLLSKAEADAAMRVVLEDYGHYATGRKPRQGEDAVLILDEFSALASGVDAAINLAERVRDVGVQVVVAAQSVEGLGNQHQAPRLLASCAGGIVVHQCPDPERLLALAGTVRDVEHNWEVDRYGPRGVAKARMRDRSRVDPELVRAAAPGEAWVIQAGHAVHLRVLPPPAVAPEVAEPAAVLPLGERDTEPLRPRARCWADRRGGGPHHPGHPPRRPAGAQAPAAARQAAGTGAGLAAAGLAARSPAGTAMSTLPGVRGAGGWRGSPGICLPVSPQRSATPRPASPLRSSLRSGTRVPAGRPSGRAFRAAGPGAEAEGTGRHPAREGDAVSTVYLLHFLKPIGNPANPHAMAQHYLGTDLSGQRISVQTVGGPGAARIVAHVQREGIGFVVAATWPGSRALERQLKRRKNAPKLCPVCRGGGQP